MSFLPETPTEVLGLFQKKGNQTRAELEDVQGILLVLLQSFEVTYFCVDAIDECAQEHRKTLLGFFKSLSHTQFHLLLTGRPVVDVNDYLRCDSIPVLNIQAKEIDLKIFLEEKIAQSDSSNSQKMDDTLEEEVIRRLIERSEGRQAYQHLPVE